MLKNILVFFGFIVGISSICSAQESIISDEVKMSIKSRVENGINVGIVVGVINSNSTTFYSYGVKSLKSKEVVDENSVFEIGSISKTFTGILLADMVRKGILNLDDPLQKLLPEGITAPTRNGESIKLYQLSNHTSSLPSMPNNLTPANPSNPFIDYSEEQLYEFLRGYKLTQDIGSDYEYSNYAVGLLGHVLANRSKTTYEDLMMEVIAKPLHLENTSTVFTSNMKENLAIGHNNGVEVENWDMKIVAGAGGIRSTAVDMLNYVAANMGIQKSNLYPAMQLSHKNSRSVGLNPKHGLGWHITMLDDLEIIWHNGSTGGYQAFAGFVNGGDKGVIVFTNSTTSIDDIGFHLLHPSSNLINLNLSIEKKLKNIIESEGIDVAVKTYWELKKNHTNQYDFSENQLNTLGYHYLKENKINNAISIFNINVEAFPNSSNAYDSYGEALMINNENTKAIESYKKSVELNPSNINGIEMLKKLGVDTGSLLKVVTVENAILESYVGKYELAPGYYLTVAKYGSQLKAQATNEPERYIFPKLKNVFYFKEINAQITFNKNKDGEIESLSILIGGQEVIGKKIAD